MISFEIVDDGTQPPTAVVADGVCVVRFKSGTSTKAQLEKVIADAMRKADR